MCSTGPAFPSTSFVLVAVKWVPMMMLIPLDSPITKFELDPSKEMPWCDIGSTSPLTFSTLVV